MIILIQLYCHMLLTDKEKIIEKLKYQRTLIPSSPPSNQNAASLRTYFRYSR